MTAALEGDISFGRKALGQATADMADQARAGTAELEFTQVHGRTVLSRSRATSPLRIVAPRNRASRAAWAFTSSFGGGLLAGDHLDIHIRCHPGSTAYLASQSSTKIYRSANGAAARQTLRATVGEGALLILAPDPVVPYASARYEQSQHFDMAPGGSLILLDWFTSGRRARGESWQLASLSTRTGIRLNGRRVLTDVVHLTPDHGPLGDAFRMADVHCMATLVMLGPRVSLYARELLAYAGTYPVEHHAPLVISASPLGDGMILRLASTATELAMQALHSSLACLSELLSEHPWSRKW